MITSFLFRVRNVPAALYKALGGFATNGVNMTKLESYMVDGDFTRRSSTPTSTAIRRTRRCASPGGAEFFSREVEILGVYPAYPFRFRSVQPEQTPDAGVRATDSPGRIDLPNK